MNYYFLGTLLPELQIGQPPELSFEELSFLMKANLSESDFAQAALIKLYFDIQNIRAFWTEQTLSKWGNYNQAEMEEALLTKTGFPDFVFDYTEKYDTLEKKLKNFAKVHAEFFQYAIELPFAFIRELFSEERKIRLILTALRAKKMGRNFLYEFQFEDPEDDLVAQILAQKDAKNYEPPHGFEDLKIIFEKYQESPLELHKALLEYRFRKVQQLLGLQTFTLDRILGYFYQLILVDKWNALDKDKGEKLIHTLVKGAA